MHDDRDALLPPDSRTPRRAHRRAARIPGGQALVRLGVETRHALRRRLTEASEALATSLLDPKNVERLQHGLVAATNLALNLGFARDSRAARLFSLVDWLEQRHGRPRVAAIVFSHSPLADGSLVNVLRALQPDLVDPLLAELGPLGDLLHDGSPPPAFHEALTVAQRKLLHLLCTLAALESDQPAPLTDAPVADLVAYFEESPIPTDYYDLAALVAGDPNAWRTEGGGALPLDPLREPTGGGSGPTCTRGSSSPFGNRAL